AGTKSERHCHCALSGTAALAPRSGRGLGPSFAQERASQGASVIVNDVNEDAAAETVEAIQAAGGRAEAVVAPVGPTSSADLLVNSAVEKFGRLDILVTNAGILRDRSLLKMTDEDFDAVINVHLKGTFTCVRSAFGYFKENGIAGRIITIGSPTGQRGNFGQSNYAAAKAGIVGMVRTWALEMKRAGVTINAIIPEAATDMTKTVPYFQKAVEADERGEAMPAFFRETLGFGTPQDVAGLVAFLSSDEAANISGQAIGAGGDRMQVWKHPEPAVTEFNPGGWTYEALQERGKNIIEDNLQSVGV